MGRKSSNKKLVRKMVKEKAEKQKAKLSLFQRLIGKKKSKKQIKDEAIKESKAPKKTKKTKPKKKKAEKKKASIPKNELLGAGLALIMLAILVVVGYLLFQRAFRPQPIATLLPQETIVSLEINSNFNHDQFSKGFDHLKNYPLYSKEKFQKSIEDKFLVDFESEIMPWLGRQVGVAYLHDAEEVDLINTIYFAEMINLKNAEQFINKLATPENFDGSKLYSLPEDRGAITFKNNYLFFSRNKSALEQLVLFHNSNQARLYDSPKYQKIYNNLPISSLANVHLNFSQFSESFFEFVPFFRESNLLKDLVSPFLTLFDSEGLALVALDDKFAVQSFMNLKTDKLKNKSYITFKEKYRANLAQYIKQDAAAFWGGKNFEFQLKRMVQALSGGENKTEELIDSILQNYTQKYFGSGISLSLDILPIFRDEFAFAIEQSNGENIYKLILQFPDAQTGLNQLNKVADNFSKVGAIFEQRVVDHTLPDGTVGQEIMAIPKEIIRKQHRYNNTEIYELYISSEKQVFYTVSNTQGVISNNIDGVKSVIDLQNGEGVSLSSSETFTNLIDPILKNSDEVSYFNLEKLLKNKASEYLLPISSLSAGKNYFNDGISTINYLDIK